MNNQAQLVNKIKDSENVLITVGSNPTVDELTACLGLALAIDKLKKHTLAIFSGQIPQIMNFLKPEKTFETSTDSFADFIISLDKSKADKLRYRVEGDFVKIFITPYHTTISPTDLKFSSGDLNVDLLIAIGVKNKDDIDKAAYEHGKILHSATIATINLKTPSAFGAINYASESGSYSETVAGLLEQFDAKLFTKAIATALLTGIVVETGQFSNAKTTPLTMSIASKLLSYGADQQLIVKEINAQNAGGMIDAETVHDIPLEIGADVNIESNMTQENVPEAYDDFAKYMPPPLPDFSKDLPPSPMPEVEETDQSVTPLPPPVDTTIQAKTEPVVDVNSPSQFKIPV